MERGGTHAAESFAFVFTDVAGSTALWEDAADEMRLAMTTHDELIETVVDAAGGALVRPRGEGDGRFAVFTDAGAALRAAARIQSVIASEHWTTPRPIRVRIAVHVGAAQLRDGDYYGTAVNRCARMRGVAHAGQTVASAEAVAAVGATGSSELIIRDLGEHRLRDIPDAQRLYQIAEPGAAAEFPPLLSLDVVPHNLPVALEPLVGRDRELARLSNLLASQRLITVVGPGGTGKTRLSIAAATDALHRFPDGVWLCDLSLLTDPGLVPRTVAKTIGVQDDGVDVDAALTAHVGDKALLIVMDNCEHVIDAAAKTIANLLQHTRNAAVLATSQERMAVTGEHIYQIQPLAPSDAISLFEMRARALNPEFALDRATEPDVRAICAKLDGIPLAVQLAAARVRTLTPTQIRERLHDRFQLLTTTNRSAPERQRTLAATLEWSHDLLAEPERVLYRRLGVFHGGAVLEAIEKVCTDDMLERLDVVDLLQRLIDRSLVIGDLSGTIPRYRMLETMLEHARTKLAAANETRCLRDRHLDWIRRQAEDGYHGAYGPDAEHWWELLRGDGPNRRAALAWSLDGGDAVIGLEAASFLLGYWIGEGESREGAKWVTALLAATPDEPSPVRARSLMCLAGLHDISGGDAVPVIEQALAMARALGDHSLEGHVENTYGAITATVAGPAAAAPHFEAARTLLPEGHELRPAVDFNIAFLYVELARYTDAIAQIGPMLELARADDDEYQVAQLTGLLGMALVENGDVQHGRDELFAAIESVRRIGNRELMAGFLTAHADALLRAGELDRAAADAREALNVCRSIGDRLMIAEGLVVAADVAAVSGALPDASAMLAVAERLAGDDDAGLTPRAQRNLERVRDLVRTADPECYAAARIAANERSIEDIIASSHASVG